MDERLLLGSTDPATLRMLLERERAHRTALEQEVARLQAGLARQNERIAQLEQENAQLRRETRELRELIAGLTEQNRLLRQQVAALQSENDRLRGGRAEPHQPSPWPSERTKQDTPPKPRRKRDRRHNHGRQRMSRIDERVTYAVESCPRCGTRLHGGWPHRRVQVIELPAPMPARVIEHVLLRRQCPRCGHRCLPPVPGLTAGRLGRCRFGPRLLATVATMACVERLPLHQIQARLAREYALELSHGGIVGLVHLVAQQGMQTYEAIKQEIRGSPMVHMDETGWRQDGEPGYIWTLSTPTACLFHRDARRLGRVADALLGPAFAGTLVTDFYAAYDHVEGPKQRCWAHLWRDIDTLVREHPEHEALATWVAGVKAIWQAATGPRPPQEQGHTPEAERARAHRAHRYEQQLLLLCPEQLPADAPHATLAKRCRRYLSDLFTFVRDPRVPATNNQAERDLRPLVIARKVSGGTRSATGSETRMILHSLAATARRRGMDPTAFFLQVLAPPPGSLPSHTL
jgi:ribosomal protein S27AE